MALTECYRCGSNTALRLITIEGEDYFICREVENCQREVDLHKELETAMEELREYRRERDG